MVVFKRRRGDYDTIVVTRRTCRGVVLVMDGRKVATFVDDKVLADFGRLLVQQAEARSAGERGSSPPEVSTP